MEHPPLTDLHEQHPILHDLSVVIPTLGRAILRDCLYCIARGTAWPAQLIVVDQGNNDTVAQWLETLQSKGLDTMYIPSSERGRALGINRGLERVQSRFVAITDDDCFVDAAWLQHMEAHLQANPQQVVTGRVEAAGDEAGVMGVTSQTPAVYHRPRLPFDALSGGNMGAPMQVFEQVGYFDEDPRIRTAEDAEWSYRILRAGISIHYAPDVIVQHVGWRDDRGRQVQYRDYARSHGGFYGKYLRKGDGFIALRMLVHHGRALRRWVRGTLQHDAEAARMGRAYFTGLMPGIIAGMRKEA